MQTLCATRLASLGYTVESHTYATGVNVLGVKAGSTKPAERVIVCAHYDGVNACAAADDNGSGVAGALETARVLATHDFARTLVVACWDEEERGALGPTAYATRAQGAGEIIQAVFDFDGIGYRSTAPSSQTMAAGFDLLFPTQAAAISANGNRADFIAIIHDQASVGAAAALQKHAVELSLPTCVMPVPEALKKSSGISNLRRSDHAPFWDADYPAIQLTDTGGFRNPHYHCAGGSDAVSDVDLDFMTRVVKSTAGAAADALEPR